MNGQLVGSELKLEKPQQQVALTARLNSIIPVDHWEAACNGKLVQELRLDVARVSADIRGTIPVKQSGWCILRAWSQKAEYPVLDNYATRPAVQFDRNCPANVRGQPRNIEFEFLDKLSVAHHLQVIERE